MNKEIVLLFDCDGTIFDTLEAYSRGYIKNSKLFGLGKQTKKDFIKLYFGNFTNSLIEKGLTKDKVLSLINIIREPYKEELQAIKPFTDIKKIFSFLKNKVKIYVITSNITNITLKSIKLYDIHGISEVLGGDKETSKVKKIETVKNIHKNCVFYYIGDTVGDIKESREAGIKSISVSWGYHSKKELKKAKPDYIVDTPKELINLLSSLIND